MFRHLLVTCDLGWVRNYTSFRLSLEDRFDKVTLSPLVPTLEELDIEDVTDWITDPAPRYKISSELLSSRLPSLLRIGSPSTGTTHIDIDVQGTGVSVKCLRDIPSETLSQITSSSEHTFYLFLSLLRRAKRLFSADLTDWRDDLPSFRGHQISGMKIMIFGYGRIGSNLARYFDAFNAVVTVYEPDVSKHSSNYHFVDLKNLHRAVNAADCVFLCFHWSIENEQFFSSSLLDAMRSDSFLVNTSRGENLDEAHLVKLIERGKFAGVALDVMRGEQTASFRSSPLFSLEKLHERLIITPHIAGSSFESEHLAFQFILDAIT